MKLVANLMATIPILKFTKQAIWERCQGPMSAEYVEKLLPNDFATGREREFDFIGLF